MTVSIGCTRELTAKLRTSALLLFVGGPPPEACAILAVPPAVNPVAAKTAAPWQSLITTGTGVGKVALVTFGSAATGMSAFGAKAAFVLKVGEPGRAARNTSTSLPPIAT